MQCHAISVIKMNFSVENSIDFIRFHQFMKALMILALRLLKRFKELSFRFHEISISHSN